MVLEGALPGFVHGAEMIPCKLSGTARFVHRCCAACVFQGAH